MARWSSRPLAHLAGALLALALLLTALPSTFAQSDSRFFPETGHTLRGLFRVFWEANGAAGIFGFPITEEYAGPGGQTVQWFERSRFELATVNGQLQVVLGNVGSETIGDRIFPRVPPIENSADRRYIPQTQHIIQYGFKEVWETRGDARIFGYPLSEEIDEVLDDGEWHTVQYFEKARFEYWPNLPPGQRVLLSLLGRRLAPPGGGTAPTSTPQPQGTPTPQPQGTPTPQPQGTPTPDPALPASVHATVSPQSGPPGTRFTLVASGFDPGEKVGIWLTAPDQSTYGADFQSTADSQGAIGGADIGVTTDTGFPAGIWSFNAQGVRSGRQAVGYFRISGESGVGDPGRLGVVAHDQLPHQGQAVIAPAAAPPGATFVIIGGGLTGGEEVSAWITGPDGKSAPIADSQVKASGTSAQAVFSTAGLPEGIYNAVIEGRTSKVIAAAAFKLTRDYVAGPGTPRPSSVNGGATPAEGGPGTVFQVRGQGFQPGESLEVWTTDPTGSYIVRPDPLLADGSGRIGYQPQIDLSAPADANPGVYGVHFRSKASGARVDIYFTVVRGAKAAPGSPGWAAAGL